MVKFSPQQHFQCLKGAYILTFFRGPFTRSEASVSCCIGVTRELVRNEKSRAVKNIYESGSAF